MNMTWLEVLEHGEGPDGERIGMKGRGAFPESLYSGRRRSRSLEVGGSI